MNFAWLLFLNNIKVIPLGSITLIMNNKHYKSNFIFFQTPTENRSNPWNQVWVIRKRLYPIYTAVLKSWTFTTWQNRKSGDADPSCSLNTRYYSPLINTVCLILLHNNYCTHIKGITLLNLTASYHYLFHRHIVLIVIVKRCLIIVLHFWRKHNL